MSRRVPIDRIGESLRWALPRYGADRGDWIVRRLAEPLGRAADAEIVAAELRSECGEYRAVAVAIRCPAGTAQLLVLQVAELEPANVGRGKPSLQDVAKCVLAPVMEELSSHGVRFLQANCDDDSQASMLAAAGFEPIADVGVMSLSKERFSAASRRLGGVSIAAEPSCLPLEDLGDRGRTTLLRVLAETFVETRDCPKLNRFLSGERWAEAFLAAPTFDPGLTSLLRDESGWVGCLLLSRHRRRSQHSESILLPLTGVTEWIPAADEPAFAPDAPPEAIELVYMGVVRGCRGRGWGSLAVTRTIRIAEAVGAERVVLAVDLRNRPAVSIYRRAGWSEMLRESVWGLAI